MSVEDRWKDPDACDCCGKVTSCPTNEHFCIGGGYTFVWCRECEKDQNKCDEISSKALGEILRQREERRKFLNG